MFVNRENVEVKMKTLEETLKCVDEITLRRQRDGSFNVMVLAQGRYINLVSVNIDKDVKETLADVIALSAEWACRI